MCLHYHHQRNKGRERGKPLRVFYVTEPCGKICQSNTGINHCSIKSRLPNWPLKRCLKNKSELDVSGLLIACVIARVTMTMTLSFLNQANFLHSSNWTKRSRKRIPDLPVSTVLPLFSLTLFCPIRPLWVIREILTGLTPAPSCRVHHYNGHSCFKEGDPLESQVTFICLQIWWIILCTHFVSWYYLGRAWLLMVLSFTYWSYMEFERERDRERCFFFFLPLSFSSFYCSL